MLRFLHAADFHLDSPFRSLEVEQAVARRRESRELLERLARHAARVQADVVLLSGDLFDSDNAYRETAEALARALGSIPAPVFLAPGNHDWYGPGSPYAALDWPENVHIFRTGTVESVELPGLNTVVHGAAFTAPEQTGSLLEGFTAPADGKCHLMVLHGDVGASEARYDPLTEEEIARSGLTYLALGHIHSYSGLRRAGATVWAYPGCPEGRGFDELGDKGILEGTVDDRGTVALTFVPLARRRYESLRLDVTDRQPLEALEEALPPQTASDLYRITFTGETGEAGVDLPGLTEALADRFYHLELRDETRIREDVWARAQEDTLRGVFLRRLRLRWDGAQTEEDRQAITAAARFGLAALDNRDLG